MAQKLILKRKDGTEVNLGALTDKVLEKALNFPQDEVMLLALESGTKALHSLAPDNPKLEATMLLAGQDLANWLLTFCLLGAMMAQTIDRNGLVLEVVDEDMNEHHSEETSDGDGEAGSSNLG